MSTIITRSKTAKKQMTRSSSTTRSSMVTRSKVKQINEWIGVADKTIQDLKSSTNCDVRKPIWVNAIK